MKHQPIFLLDFDGVIVDSLDEAYVNHGVFMRKLGKTPLTREGFRLMYMDNAFIAYKKLGIKNKDLDLIIEIIKERNRKGLARVDLYPGIIKLVKFLSEYHLVIISSSSTEAIEEYLARKKMLKYFQEVQGAEEGLSKITKIKKTIRKLKSTASEIYYVTDTVGDIIEAKKAEVKIIAVGWGFHYREELLKVKPDYFFNIQEEFIQALPNL